MLDFLLAFLFPTGRRLLDRALAQHHRLLDDLQRAIELDEQDIHRDEKRIQRLEAKVYQTQANQNHAKNVRAKLLELIS